MDDPLVSVVTCFLDADRFLDEAIESVFSQTLPSWELLLVDDGSRDQSAKSLALLPPGIQSGSAISITQDTRI